jgi:putative ABC transport system permease protein
MSIPILAGRAFGKTDGHGSQEVAIVNEMFAREYLSGKPLGHRIKRENMEDNSAWAEIVGEVRDSRDFSLFDKPAAEYYIPAAQASFLSGTNFLVRTTIDPFAILTAVRQRIRDLDRNAPITDIKTMDQVVAEQVVEPRFRTLLLTSFGLLALVLAVVGIYGAISYTVVQRTHEIGIRMALGAKPGQILRMVIHEGMLFAGFGLAVGIAGALVLTRFLESLLFAIKPTDPASFLGVSILLAAVVLLACYIPARRAAKVDPMVALRYE